MSKSKPSAIKIKNKTVYYNEIIDSNEFRELYLKEKPILSFKSKIILVKRPFLTLLSKYRKNHFNEGNILIVRLTKGNQEAQFISKIQGWGKVYIPLQFVKLLNLKNHEKVLLQVIGCDKDLNSKQTQDVIDLTQIKAKIIPRKNNLITIYFKYKTSITLPRFIQKTPNLFELFYLIHGDGHYQYKFYFVSKTLELHKFVLKEFENIFKIPQSVWRSRLLIYNLDDEKFATNFWQKNLNLSKKQFYNTSKTIFRTSNKGNLRIIIDKTIMSVIFKFIFEELKKDDRFLIYALNGLLYAEGGAQIENKGLHKLTLSFNLNEKRMFQTILDKLMVPYRIEQNKNFIISTWNNQYIFFKLFLFNGVVPFAQHYQRKELALRGFLDHSFTNTMIKYLGILYKKQCSVKDLAITLNIRQDSVLSTLRRKQYREFIHFSGKGINKNPFMISISDEGKIFLRLINIMTSLKKDTKSL